MSIYDNRFQMLITATLENSLPHGSSNIPTEILEMRNRFYHSKVLLAQ